ncbi:MAG: OsmC family protein [Nitrospirota bacterium]
MGNKGRDLGAIVSRRIEFFREKPESAIYRPRVSSRHIKNLYTETKARDHVVRADYAEAAGGDNLAPNPIELLLSAFAACIESAFFEFAVYEGLTVNSIKIDVEGTLDLRGLFMIDENVSAGFKDITYNFKVETPEDENKISALAQKVIAHCPVVDSLIKPTSIAGKIIVNKKG